MDLKLGTAGQEILLGPFLDDDDGITQKTGLTIANTDIKLHKTGGTTLGNKNSGGATEIATGFYYATLDATDTDTLGPLVIVVQMTDCLCVRHEFNVVSAAYFDWVYGTTKPDVNTYSITANAITATAINADAITADKIADNAIAAEHLANNAIDLATFAADCKTGSALKANVETITNNAITALSIADGAITNAKVADDVDVNVKTVTAGAITNAACADDIDVNVKTMTAGVITDTVIANGAIDFATFAADCKTGTGLKANVESISANAITATAIQNDAITADKIAAAAIDNATFAADVGSTAYATNIIALAAKKAVDEYDGPTNAEFELRSLPTADYTIVSDLGTVQTGDSFAIVNGDHGLVSIQDDVDSIVAAVITNAAGTDVAADIIALKAVADLIEDILRNQLEVTDADGAVVLRADNSTDALYTVAACVTDNSTTTTRKRLA